MISNYDPGLESKWAPVLEGIDDDYKRKVTATLLENQAKSIVSERMDETVGTDAPTTVGKLGTFQKFAFPLVRRVYPQLLANNLVGVQPMQGPVSQIFYLGHDRNYGGGADGARNQNVFSRFNLTYANLTNSAIDTGIERGVNELENVRRRGYAQFSGANIGLSALGLSGNFGTCGNDFLSPASPSATVGGQIASFPVSSTILGYSVSAGEALTSTGIPELNMHIDQQPVVARTRKMRSLWTLEAAQDLRAYHNLDLEGELTSLLSKELALEIDREIIEDLRMIAYDPSGHTGWNVGPLVGGGNSNNFQTQGNQHPKASPTLGGAPGSYLEGFTPSAFLYQFANAAVGAGSGPDLGKNSNVWLVDLTRTDNQFGAAPQHVGQVYSNLLAIINFAAQDIYRTTWRGPGNWLITSPLVASMLESAAKLEGGIPEKLGPTNIGKNAIQYKGKFAGRYDLWVDPMYPEDEIMVGYKGDNAMDSGYVYAPYIPLQALPTITDPQDFQPRKGILTRYGKAAVGPYYRFYRIIRIVGGGANYLFNPFGKAGGSSGLNYTGMAPLPG